MILHEFRSTIIELIRRGLTSREISDYLISNFGRLRGFARCFNLLLNGDSLILLEFIRSHHLIVCDYVN
jgi:hypothetical protein